MNHSHRISCIYGIIVSLTLVLLFLLSVMGCQQTAALLGQSADSGKTAEIQAGIDKGATLTQLRTALTLEADAEEPEETAEEEEAPEEETASSPAAVEPDEDDPEAAASSRQSSGSATTVAVSPKNDTACATVVTAAVSPEPSLSEPSTQEEAAATPSTEEPAAGEAASEEAPSEEPSAGESASEETSSGEASSQESPSQEDPAAGESSSSGTASAPTVTQLIYRGNVLSVLPTVAVNTYDPSCFTYYGSSLCRYTGTGYTSMVGIDVSKYQGTINWTKVAAAGVEFAMIRVGYRGYSAGTINLDSQFYTNIEGALAAGLKVGVYFFSQAITTAEAKEEAQFVLNAIQGYNITFPVAFDWERIGTTSARTDNVGRSTLTSIANTFCSTVQAAGYQTSVYFYTDLGYMSYNLADLSYPYWLCQYSSVPTFYYNFSMWQYSSTGTVPGISGNVDMNLYFIPTT